MTGVFSYSEEPGLASEVASAGAEIASMLGTDSAALELDEVSDGLRCTRVVVARGARRLEADADSAASAICQALRPGFQALLVGETRFGTVVAAKVAAKLRVGSLGKGKDLQVDRGRLVLSRDVYGGKFVAKVAVGTPCVALVQPGSYPPAGGPPVRVETLDVEPADAKVAILERRERAQTTLDVRSAPVVVSAGRGFAKKEDLALARDLADALGAALGGSRPLTSELGWMGEEQQIGLTGAYVHPKLYVAIGISGQLQHLAGVKDSKLIVAINKDGQAPIFQAADYGIVGDLYQVVPALTRAIKKG